MKHLFLVGVLASLSVSVFGQTITKLELTKDNGKGKPGAVEKGFGTKDSPIHCVVHLRPLASTTVFTGTLFATKAANLSNYKVVSTNLSASMHMDFVDFKFSLPRPWPVGSYRVEVKANGKLLKEISFEIK